MSTAVRRAGRAQVNHRKLLDGIFEVCGVAEAKIRTISSAVDKLDKLPWADVRREMVDEKGLEGDVADRIGEFVKLKGARGASLHAVVLSLSSLAGGPELLERLKADATLAKSKRAQEALADMELLFDYVGAFGAGRRVRASHFA